MDDVMLVIRSSDGVVVNRIIGALPSGYEGYESVAVPEGTVGIDIGWVRESNGSFVPSEAHGADE